MPRVVVVIELSKGGNVRMLTTEAWSKPFQTGRKGDWVCSSMEKRSWVWPSVMLVLMGTQNLAAECNAEIFLTNICIDHMPLDVRVNIRRY